MAARLAIARAQHQLATEAGVHLHVRNFQVINQARSAFEPSMTSPGPQGWTHAPAILSCAQVGAVSLRATLNCEAFADAHRDTAHYDQDSFVGLAWRPFNEACCCEIYSTGRAK